MKHFVLISICLLLICSFKHTTAVFAFQQKEPLDTVQKTKPAPDSGNYHNKVLGMLLGSAIGDAMGAPTEMWSRKDILIEYGFVTGLDTMVRSPSGEGTWHYNLPAGGTTDDTRWKQLMVHYATTQPWPDLNPTGFATFIQQNYLEQIRNLKETDSYDPAPFEDQARRMAWLQEWALVSKSYLQQDMQGYLDALSKFYGGEMTCAGMLYSPVIGACTPSDPASAYQQAYALSIFDLGYARDMTALVSAMVAASFQEGATPASVLDPVRNIDPQGYFQSRLVGRAAYRFYRQAKEIVYNARSITSAQIPADLQIPAAMQQMDSLAYYSMFSAFENLDHANEDLPFHPGEIFLIALTAMLYADFDFERTMTFIVNYGRDNDTVAAIAGAILGAYWGAERLPQDKVKTVIQVNKELLGIDIPALAAQMTEHYQKLYQQKP